MQTTPQQTAAILDLTRIPSLPQILIELIDACSSQDVDLQTVGTIVCRDAAISARILQLANSAFLGTRTSFSDIEQAVIYLGIDTVRNLAISVSVHEAFRSYSGPAGTSPARFWYHSLLTAVLAKSLAQLNNYPRPAEAYLAGLLHDLGKLLLEQAYPQEYRRIAERARLDQTRLEVLEKNRFGISHSEAGSQMVLRWKLQPSIATAIELHHSDDIPGHPTDPLVAILYLANLLSTAPAADQHLKREFCERLGISAQALSECLTAAAETVSTIAEHLGFTIESTEISQIDQPDADSGRTELLEKVGKLSRMHGILDNLIRADTPDRSLRVIEESLHILYDVDRCMIFLPEFDGNGFSGCCSEVNPLTSQADGLKISRADGEEILAMCPEWTRGVCLLAQQDGGAGTAIENQLYTLFASPFLLILALPAGDWRGFLVAAIDSRQTAHLQDCSDDLSFLARHAAFRLYLNVINRKTAEDLARERVEAVQQVARSIAHEINNPLAILQNYLSILDHRLAGKPDIHEELVMFNAEISRIGNVCAQLDDLSGTPPPHAASPVDLGSLLQECLGLFQQSLFQHQKITSYLDVAPQLPTIPSNPDLLRQILGNLLKNAAEALPVGGKVWLRCESIGHDRQPGTEGIRITIEDNGPGISPALAGKLFRAGVTDKDGGHLGIGLAIVKKLVTELGGSIDWCPRSGGGTCFTIDFLTKI